MNSQKQFAAKMRALSLICLIGAIAILFSVLGFVIADLSSATSQKVCSPIVGALTTLDCDKCPEFCPGGTGRR